MRLLAIRRSFIVKNVGWLEKHSDMPAELACGKAFAQLFPNLVGGRVENAINSALRHGFPAFLSQSLNKSPFDLYSKSASNGSISRIQQAINVVPINGDNGQRYAMLQEIGRAHV